GGGGGRAGRRVAREDPPLRVVDGGRTHVLLRLEGGEGAGRRLRVVEQERRGHVGGEDLRLRGQPADHRRPEGDDVVDDEGGGGEEEGEAAGEHGHPGELLPDREVAQRPDEAHHRGCLTTAAPTRAWPA